jgi:hypothetical protein
MNKTREKQTLIKNFKDDSLDRSLEKLYENDDIKIASEGIRLKIKTLIKRFCVVTGWIILKQCLRNNYKIVESKKAS